MLSKLLPFDFYVLFYDVEEKDFVLVTITSEYCRDITVAKTKALYSFGFADKDVPVIIDQNGCRYYYSFRLKTWFKSPSDKMVRHLFSHLVPPTEWCMEEKSLNAGAPI